MSELSKGEDTLPVRAWTSPNENEERAFRGFLQFSDFDQADVELIQFEVPIGRERVGEAAKRRVEIDLSLADVLSIPDHSTHPRGFLNERELARKFGSQITSYTASVDVVVILPDTVLVIEIKTRNQRIKGMHDVYEGLGQILMNRDRFEEDYPTVAAARDVQGVLLAEGSQIDTTLIRPSFVDRRIGFFDPVKEGYLIEPQ